MSQRRLTRQESRARTRAALVDAGRRVFARRGFHAASVEEIAEEAGFSIGAVYSNFAGKEDLFLEVFEDFLATRARDVEAASTGGSGVEGAHAAGDQWMDLLKQDPSWFPLFVEFWSYAIRNPELRPRFAARLGALRVTIGRLLEARAAELGVDLPMPPERLGTIFKALGNGLALEKLADPDGVPDELYGEFLGLLLSALQDRDRA